MELVSLGALAAPSEFTCPIKIGNESPNVLFSFWEKIMVIRRTEEKIGEKILTLEIVCPCHLAIGQEAIAVGACDVLRSTDRVFGTHRSHSHFLAMNGTVESLLAEVLGKKTGCSKGMGGSMHLYSANTGFIGSVPIVAATVSLAVGAALAAKLDRRESLDVGVAFFGDGATEEGTVHESLNLAINFRLPMVFVCENNFFSSHLHINLRQPSDLTARYAEAHRMAVEVVDGNDVLAVRKAMARLVERARAGEGPGYLEAVTYRWRGHVGPSEDDDVGLKRKGDLALWKKRDPADRLKSALITAGHFRSEDFDRADENIRAVVERAWDQAVAAPYPDPSALLDLVYTPTSEVSK